MAIKPVCDRCGQELKEFGALLFGPPDENSKVVKNHLCSECYLRISQEIAEKTANVEAET